MNDKLKPALIGGVILGILSAIPAVNYCCCIWAIVGGLIAANLYIKKSATPATPADGAVIGAIAGAIGVALIIVIGIPLNLIVGTALLSLFQGMVPPDQAAQMNQMMAAGVGIGSAIKSALIVSVCSVIFSAIGGLIGVAIFEKRKGGAGVPPPPPPPGGGYGGPGGGYGQGA
jgi:hypothetical protein